MSSAQYARGASSGAWTLALGMWCMIIGKALGLPLSMPFVVCSFATIAVFVPHLVVQKGLYNRFHVAAGLIAAITGVVAVLLFI